MYKIIKISDRGVLVENENPVNADCDYCRYQKDEPLPEDVREDDVDCQDVYLCNSFTYFLKDEDIKKLMEDENISDDVKQQIKDLQLC